MATRKKLYFDVLLPNATSLVRTFPCTQFRSTRSYTGDSYGNVLQDLPACTNTTSNTVKAKSEVSAYFVPNQGVMTGNLGVMVAFVNATTNAGGVTNLVAPNTARSGSSAIYTRHFGVLVRKFGTSTMRGRVIVSRPHSIEV